MKKFVLTLLVLLLSSLILAEKPFLLLYNSSEAYGEYMFKNYIVPVLQKFGIQYELKNVIGLNYNEIDPERYSLVISWYYSPNVPYPETYLRQLANFVNNGGKFLFLNNLGVSTSFREINNLMNLLGVHYKGGYKNIQNVKLNYFKEYFLEEPSKGKDTPIPVEKYEIYGKDVKILLSYTSEDGTFYPMIFLSSSGGGAVFNSFVKDGKVIIDFERLVYDILATNVGKENKVLIVKERYDTDIYLSSQYHYSKIFELAKIDYDFVDFTQFYRFSIFDINKYKFIIWNTDSLYFDSKFIKTFVENGGTFIFSTNVYNTPWRSYIVQKSIPINKLLFDKSLFPFNNTANGTYYALSNFSLTFNLSLPDKVKVLAKLVGTEDVPAIWYEKVGNGYIGYIYPSIINTFNRGLVLQSILEMQDLSISGFLNIGTFHLDDFPLPSYNIVRKGVNDDEFYYQTWWNDMKKFSERFNIPFTAMAILTYNGSSAPPFDFTEFFVSNTNGPLKALLELYESNHELGFHGYNHNSLTRENWKNPENLILSLKTAKKFVETLIGHPVFFITYTAANNIIDTYGIENLLKAIPEIEVICTSYNLDEFGIVGNDVLVLPRATYGYYPKEQVVGTMVNTLANFGSLSHFIHTDDLFATDRNPERKDWDFLYGTLNEIYDELKSKFPWLRFLTTSEAYRYYVDYFKKSVKYTLIGKSAYINVSKDNVLPRYFIVRTKKDIDGIYGAKILAHYPGSNLYIIEMYNHQAVINFKE